MAQPPLPLSGSCIISDSEWGKLRVMWRARRHSLVPLSLGACHVVSKTSMDVITILGYVNNM